MSKVVILPTKNEEESIARVLNEVSKINVDIVVLADDSSDNTRNVALEVSKTLGINTIICVGVGNESPTIKKAISELSEDSLIAIVDADGSQDVSIIPKMFGELDRDTGLVVGSRYAKNGDRGSSTVFSSFGNTFARIVLGLKTKELTSRFVVGTKNMLLQYCDWEGRGEDSIELIYNVEKAGYAVKEVPFAHVQRFGGESKTNVPKYLWKYFWKVIERKVKEWKPYSDDYIQRGIQQKFVEEDIDEEAGFLAKTIGFCQIPIYLIMSFPARIPIVEQFYAMVAINWPRGIAGFWLRTCYHKHKFGGCGQDVFIDYGTTIFNHQSVYLRNNIHIDERISIIAASGILQIGNFVHIAGSCCLQCKGGIEIGEYSTISYLSKIYSATNYYKNEEGEFVSCSAMAPCVDQFVIRKKVLVGKYSFVGAGCTLIPGSSVGDFTTIGANSVVNQEIPSMVMAAGCPAFVRKTL